MSEPTREQALARLIDPDAWRGPAGFSAPGMRERRDRAEDAAGRVLDAGLPALCNAYADALNRISDILDGIGDE